MTDALVDAQLEALYALGILEREQEESGGLQREHERFLTALPPAASEEDAGFGRRLSRIELSSSGGSIRSTSRPSELLDRSFQELPSKERRRRENRILQLEPVVVECFELWKGFAVKHRHSVDLRILADMCLKKRGVARWCGYLHWRKYEHDQQFMIQQWKLTRACAAWKEHANRRRQIRMLLTLDGRSFACRFRKVHVWQRWSRWAKTRQLRKMQVEIQTQRVAQRLLRATWNIFRAHVFHSVHARLLLQFCFHQMLMFRSAQWEQRRVVADKRAFLNRSKVRRILKQWRKTTYLAGYERKCMVRICKEITRKRFFRVWRRVYRNQCKTASFRRKRTRKSLLAHLRAWRITHRAVTMGNQVLHVRGGIILREMFTVWVKEVATTRKAFLAQKYFESKRLLLAISALKELAKRSIEHMQTARNLQVAREKSILRQIWVSGWIPYHQKYRHMKAIALYCNQKLIFKVFVRWKKIHAARIVSSTQKRQATTHYRRETCKKYWIYWNTHVTTRKRNYQALQRADTHHSCMMMLRGLASWHRVVSQSGKYTQLLLQFRQAVRSRLKAKCFCVWKYWVQNQQQLKLLTANLHGSRTFQLSILNPKRRWWLRWADYITILRHERRSREHFQIRISRLVLHKWRKHTRVMRRALLFQSRRHLVQMQQSLSAWKSRAQWWQQRRSNYQMAAKHHCIKLYSCLFYCWIRYREYCRRVHACGYNVKHRRQLRLQYRSMSQWLGKFQDQQKLKLADKHQKRRVQQHIFHAWRRYASCRAKQHKKLVYYQRIYGKYPHTSLISRSWVAWRGYTKQSLIVKQHRQRQLTKILQCAWLVWTMFCRYHAMFRSWRQLVCCCDIKSANTRLRLFRKKQRRRMKNLVFAQLKVVHAIRRRQVEQFSRLRSTVYLELCHQLTALRLGKEHFLRRWFKRWRTSDQRASVLSTHHYIQRLLHTIVHAWWRLSVHNRQDRVLSDAKRIAETLSYFKGSDGNNKTEPRQAQLDSKSVIAHGNEVVKCRKLSSRLKTRHAKGMVDPVGPPRFSDAINRVRTMNRARELTREPSVHTLRSDHVLHLVHSRQGQIDNTKSLKDHENIPYRVLATNENTPTDNTISKPERSTHQAQPIASQQVESSSCSSKAPLTNTSKDHITTRQEHQIVVRSILKTPDQSVSNQQKVPHREPPFLGVELPLYDAEFRPKSVQDRKASATETLKQQSIASVTSAQTNDGAQKHFSMLMKTPSLEQYNSSPLSLERVAALDVYEDRISDNPQTSALHDPGTAKLFTPTQVRDHQTKDSRVRAASLVQVRRSGRPRREPMFKDRTQASEKQELTAILKVHHDSHSHQTIPSQTRTEIETVKPPVSLDMVIEHYVQLLLPAPGTTDILSTRSHEWCVCYEMVRDLGLLQNDFYICELERVFQQEPSFLPNTETEKICFHQGNIAIRLKLFLNEMLTVHPAYVQTKQIRQPFVSSTCEIQVESVSRQDEIQFPGLTWLMHKHLPSLISEKSIGKVPWIRHTIPEPMKLAFDKFIPTIKKYTSMLGQFFARGASAFQQPAVGMVDPRDYQMSRAAFFDLMKKARVFPQLFHRRELEHAFDMSIMTCGGDNAVNFPEFVELLIRCSSLLEWSNEKVHVDATIGVVKFLMLIFAMEGRGSVLRKRSKDLDVVIEFLNHHQRQSRAGKMVRLRNVLEQQEASRRSQLKMKAHRASRSVSRVLAQLSEENWQKEAITPSPARTFEDLTHSWDFNDTEESPPVTKQSSNHVSECIDHEIFGRTKSEVLRNSAGYTKVIRSESTCDVGTDAGHNQIEDPATQKQDENANYNESPTRIARNLDTINPSQEPVDQSQLTNPHTDESSIPSNMTLARCSIHTPPLSKDDFLEEIMHSIGNVELILSQASERPRRKHSKLMARMEEQDDQVSLPTISDYLTDTSNIHESDASMFSASLDSALAEGQLEDVESVEVKDAMLDYLTDVTRFCDPKDAEAANASCMTAYQILPVDLTQIDASPNDKKHDI